MIGGIYVIDERIHLERRRRDSDGNDYAFDIVTVGIEDSDEAIGHAVLSSVSESSEKGEDIGEAWKTLWQSCMEKMGCKTWAQLYKSAAYFFLYGEKDQYVELSPSVRDDGNFVPTPGVDPTRATWSPGSVGAALRRLLASEG